MGEVRDIQSPQPHAVRHGVETYYALRDVHDMAWKSLTQQLCVASMKSVNGVSSVMMMGCRNFPHSPSCVLLCLVGFQNGG